MSTPDLTGAKWRKSSHSGSNEGDCVEVTSWRKSSHSGPYEDECVEVASTDQLILFRDSKDPDGPVLSVGSDSWRRLLNSIKRADR
ncbi:DUF397 domain-containing protein [Actinomadura barringtoniae]|uniref:DUF397 domain-containing protein n=1 Tax=Actinomadura barringtoniae TaxID=1427535 RepID=A0A939PF03_9ACTN|nr:DUF397 domain-containing protein [Actinomadura barringtoniae]MBO2451455.1 DUF397 domain-containing protein [Actinomadura barringtoniae]